ncbi:hypothetical protein FisN_20Hh186 [Fistulifera solaris]|jgi:ankyrin repeat protein|uniref:Uncharacterized protein n=1 Tax=Fistulifera solaris TaxID=1519565 RepID=A0A1Z5JK81_FISSO|nr:hypothetical protein FisN_20Hh186 [Fistulifera solaris]|eukprot:GAX14191.1 hypothetical protein FisN_20Hh186 [Fistulifera solaris]
MILRTASLLLAFASITSIALGVVDSEAFQDFLEDCSDGKLKNVEEAIAANPTWASETSADGETCLHVAGIHGQIEITKHLMKLGVDPNLLTHMIEDPEDGPIQMHALSWHVFGGHYESAKLLLEHGADPNQLMDSLTNEKERVTVLDMLEELLAEEDLDDIPEEEIAPFIKMKELLIQNGAKRRDEL